MNHILKKINGNKFELTVELGEEDLTRYLDRAENQIAKEVTIDGFRPGKAPKDAVRKKVGQDYILQQGLDLAIQDSLARTLSEQEIEVIKVSDISIKENSANKLIYSVAVTTFPAVELAELSSIKVSPKNVEVEDSEIQSTLDYIKTSRAKFIPKKGTVEKGNRVEVDFEVTSEGLPIEGGVSKNHPVIIGENKFIPGFEDQLLGMKVEEKKTFTLKAPDDYFHKTVAGKNLDFSVKIIDIQTVENPILDDSFAQEVGRFANLDELKNNIKTGIKEEKLSREKQRLRLEILSKLLDKSKVELPAEIVDEKIQEMISGFDDELHAKGMELAMYLTHLGKTEDDLKKDWRPEAERQVGYALILRKLAKEHNLYPEKEEIDQRVDKTVQSMVLQGQFNPENINLEKIRDAITGDMTNDKVFTFLEKNCISS